MIGLAGLLQLDLPEWMTGAVCAQTDPEVFYPGQGDNQHDAKRVCLACPVRVDCLEYALERAEPFGVWGGKSERQRRAILRARKTQVAA